MAKITVTGAEFANIVTLFLYDKLQHPDDIVEADINETFNALAEVLMRRGLKAPLLQCYMDMDPQLRVKYRMIRNVFIDNDSTQTALIEIRKDKRAEVLKPGVFTRIKSYLKKIITLGLTVKGVGSFINKDKNDEEGGNK